MKIKIALKTLTRLKKESQAIIKIFQINRSGEKLCL